jgi:PhnB protein
MSHDARPAGVTTIEPLLSVRRGKSAVEFYRRPFDASELSLIEDDKGEVVAHLSVKGAGFWVADESPAHSNFSPESIGGSSVRIVLTVADPDAVFERAVSTGATVVYPVSDHSYGWRLERLVDPFGHHWEIGKPLH